MESHSGFKCSDIEFTQEKERIYRNAILGVKFSGRKRLIEYIVKNFLKNNQCCEICYEDLESEEDLNMHLVSEHGFNYNYIGEFAFKIGKDEHKTRVKRIKIEYEYITSGGKAKEFKKPETFLDYLISKEKIMNLGDLMHIVKESTVSKLIPKSIFQGMDKFHTFKKIASDTNKDLVNYVTFCHENNIVCIDEDSAVLDSEVSAKPFNSKIFRTASTMDTSNGVNQRVRKPVFKNISSSPSENSSSPSTEKESSESPLEELEDVVREEAKKELDNMKYDLNEIQNIVTIDAESMSSKGSIKQRSVAGFKMSSTPRKNLMKKKHNFSSVRATPGKRPIEIECSDLGSPNKKDVLKKSRTTLRKRDRPDEYEKHQKSFIKRGNNSPHKYYRVQKHGGRNNISVKRVYDYRPQEEVNDSFDPHNRDSKYYKEDNYEKYYPNRLSSRGASSKNSPFTTPDKDNFLNGAKQEAKRRNNLSPSRFRERVSRSPVASRVRRPSPRKYPNVIKSPKKISRPNDIEGNSSISKASYHSSQSTSRKIRFIPNAPHHYHNYPIIKKPHNHHKRRFHPMSRQRDYMQVAMMDEEMDYSKELEYYNSMKHSYRRRPVDYDYQYESPVMMKHAAKHNRVFGQRYESFRKNAVHEQSYPKQLHDKFFEDFDPASYRDD